MAVALSPTQEKENGICLPQVERPEATGSAMPSREQFADD